MDSFAIPQGRTCHCDRLPPI